MTAFAAYESGQDKPFSPHLIDLESRIASQYYDFVLLNIADRTTACSQKIVHTLN